MKRALNTFAAVTIVTSLLVANTFAEEQMMNTAQPAKMEPPKMDQTGNMMNQSEYWAKKKLEAQHRSTEMRKRKIQELKLQGIDTSSISDDLLDASKTDEAAFWEAMKKIMANQQGSMRKKIAEELTKSGLDTSSLTADILDPSKTDEPTFWNAIKAIKDAYAKKKTDTPRQDMQQNNRVPNAGTGTSRCYGGPEGTRCGGPAIQPENQAPAMQPQTSPMYTEYQKPKPANAKPALTEKERQKLITKFKNVAEEKRAAYYAKTKANLEAQYEKIKNAKNNRLALKIKETLAILEEILGGNEDSEDDFSVLDEATN